MRAVLVLQREPLFVVGRGSFIDTMLGAAGADNLARVFAEPYPRASLEWLIAAAPELILDASRDPDATPRSYWARWPSLPAVRDAARRRGRRGEVTLPGPYLDARSRCWPRDRRQRCGPARRSSAPAAAVPAARPRRPPRRHP